MSRSVHETLAIAILGKGQEIEKGHPEPLCDQVKARDRRAREPLLDVAEKAEGEEAFLRLT